jgi:hypothetical protein
LSIASFGYYAIRLIGAEQTKNLDLKVPFSGRYDRIEKILEYRQKRCCQLLGSFYNSRDIFSIASVAG